MAESDDRSLLFWAFDKKSLSIIEIQLVFYHSTHMILVPYVNELTSRLALCASSYSRLICQEGQ